MCDDGGGRTVRTLGVKGGGRLDSWLERKDCCCACYFLQSSVVWLLKKCDCPILGTNYTGLGRVTVIYI